MKQGIAIVAIAAALVTSPAHAAEWGDVRPGTFVGARLTIGGTSGRTPRAALTIAPTMNRNSLDGQSSRRIGEGIALNFGSGQPTLTLAGARADEALGLRSSGGTRSDRKLGVSTGGWVAIGLGAAALVGAAVFYNAVTSCEDHDDEC